LIEKLTRLSEDFASYIYVGQFGIETEFEKVFLIAMRGN